MQATIYPGRLRGSVQVPPNPALLQRAFVAGALANGHTLIEADHADAATFALAQSLAALGCRIARDDTHFLCEPRGGLSAGVQIDCQKSAAALDFLLPLAEDAVFFDLPALPKEALAMRSRILGAHGVRLTYQDGVLKSEGRLKSGAYSFASPVCIRLASALLFALSRIDGISMLNIGQHAQSMRPYLDMTCDMLARFGVRILPAQHGYVIHGNQRFVPASRICVEGDWSCAALWYAAGKMGHDVTVENVSASSKQAEREIQSLLPRIGGVVPVQGRMQLLPALCAAAAVYDGTSILRGFDAAQDPRAKALARMIETLGAQASCYDKAMSIKGTKLCGGVTIDPCGDSRLAMAAALCATQALAPVTIAHAEVASKTDPDFFERLKHLGAAIVIE